MGNEELPESRSVAIFFYTGDFAESFRRHLNGEEQSYATHNEIARLIDDLTSAGVSITLYSFMSKEARDDRVGSKVRFVSVGATDYHDQALSEALRGEPAKNVIIHFPHVALIKTAFQLDKKLFVILANSFNDKGLAAWWRKRRLRRLLNNPQIELVSNHCMPATNLLAAMGVARDKLVPWDIPHRFAPHDYPEKSLVTRLQYTIAYAGAVSQAKGVEDLLAAVAILRESGREVRLFIAGGGDVDAMEVVVRNLGIGNLVKFLGVVPNNEVFALFRHADLIVVPSRPAFPEGFPLTMFEAIASRTPIVCSNHPVFEPVMINGSRAAVFTAGRPAELAMAIDSLLTDADLYQALSRNAVDTWASLKGCVDWRRLITEWVLKGRHSDWIESRIRDYTARIGENN